MIDTAKTFAALSEEFVEVYMRHQPVGATAAGLHDYDELLPDDSPDGVRARTSWLRDLDQRLVASVPWEELPLHQRVDYALLRSRIASLRVDLEDLKVYARNPARFPETALRGVFLLAARPFAPLEERKEPILARLMAIPDYLHEARASLGQVPEVLLDIASEVNASGPAFVEEVVRTLLRSFPGEAERIEHAGGRARAGFLQYQEFLEGELSRRVGGSFAIGERWMNYKLEREHMLSVGCAEVADLGRVQVERTRTLLEQGARRIDATRAWRAQLAAARQRPPEPLRLREAYVAEVERARRFTEEKHLAPLLDAPLEVIETPLFERPTTPYATYLPPAPLDVDQTGYLFVTPIDIGRRREDQAHQLEAHNYAALPLTVLHESYPGHHLQLSHANHAGSRLRLLADSSMLSEGWALYCEELMYEQGFFLDPASRLFQLRDLLWRACRVVIDVGLHTGRMSVPQAVEMLVEEAMLDPVAATIEVRRYTMTPTEPMSYVLGKLMLLELRDEARRRQGRAFTLYDFHAALLRSGTLPLPLVREELWQHLPVA